MQLRYDAGEIITAMVTPFKENREVDFAAVEKLARHLADNRSDAILVAGTTGESPTLTHEEEIEILKCVKSTVGKECKIIMGAGSNSTKTAMETTEKAAKAGADAILSVVPYYNKPSQAGMYEHFSSIAKVSKLPIILYNIPGRTGVNMLPETVAKLAKEYDNIVALKQSNSDLDLISELKVACPEDFAIYSGDDSLTLPMLSLGAYGVISVASHVVGNEIHTIIKNYKNGETKIPKNMHMYLFPLFKKLFMAPNPVPVKEVLSQMGLMNNYVRRPLVELTEEQKTELMAVATNYLQ